MLRLIRFDHTFVSTLDFRRTKVRIKLRFLSVLVRLILVNQIVDYSGIEIHS
jgi:hypothetical protein